MKVIVAMSGGVDSSVAAALLVEQGHDVIGLSMQLYDQRDGDTRFGGCCTLDDLHDARRTAGALGIPHYILNFEQQFERTVVANFVSEYTAGRTPLPCAHCNSDLKFSTLLDRAEGLGAGLVATGHYAQVTEEADGVRALRRGADPAKDQSYFLFSLTQAQLSAACFPVGPLTKAAVRERARHLGLAVADKPDSQEICFVPSGSYADFVERRAPDSRRAGAIVHEDGRTLGRHDGVHRFTVGQRKGLGVSAPAPLYVLALDAGTGTVTVGPRAALERTTLRASSVNWISGVPPNGWLEVATQVRYRHPAAPARVRALDDGRAEVRFLTAQSAVAPGQAAVFYDGDRVVGGGWIESDNASRILRAS
ncbi:MAG: tRNA 2-thiouridine(34) synthase MnmA [Acidimicrobiia bacterium]|nr:tRNA 2-thiouridine(34) synthase MnmA [Acidimicrobiia bacterium]